MTHLFSTIDSYRIAEFVRSAKGFVCYAGPGIQIVPAQAMVEVAGRLGVEAVAVAIDFDERVMRMGFGALEAVAALRSAGIVVRNSPGLRTALILVDDGGYLFTPTALFLEAESQGEQVVNAIWLSSDQVREALARLSPAAKAIAVAQSSNDEDRERFANLPVEVGTEPVTEEYFTFTEKRLEEAPPLAFDLARQVRVFNSYLQYVEVKLSGVAIQRRRLTIPPIVLKLGSSEEVEKRLRTTFDIIDKEGRLSSDELEAELNEIRRNFTPSLGKDYGRVLLKSKKPAFEKRLEAFRERLKVHQEEISKELQHQLDESRRQIVNYYTPGVIKNPPDALLGQLPQLQPTERDAQLWLDAELKRVFPKPEALVNKMRLEVQYKDMTFETLNQQRFLDAVKKAFPLVDWEKAYDDFLAAGESTRLLD